MALDLDPSFSCATVFHHTLGVTFSIVKSVPYTRLKSFLFITRHVYAHKCTLLQLQNVGGVSLPDPTTAPVGINIDCGIPKAGNGQLGNIGKYPFVLRISFLQAVCANYLLIDFMRISETKTT
jgi:hypothetical protein